MTRVAARNSVRATTDRKRQSSNQLRRALVTRNVLPHGTRGVACGWENRSQIKAKSLHSGSFRCSRNIEERPEAPNRSQHRIPSTNQHPVSVGRCRAQPMHSACGGELVLRNAWEMVPSEVAVPLPWPSPASEVWESPASSS